MVSKKVFPSNGGRGTFPAHRRSMQYKKPPVMKIPPPMLAASHMMMMEGAAAYNRLMFNTSQIPDNHSYVDFNLPTPPVQSETNANHSDNLIPKSRQKNKSSQGSAIGTQLHLAKDATKTQSSLQESVSDHAGQRRAKSVSRSSMSAHPLHMNGYNELGELATTPFPRSNVVGRRGRIPGGGGGGGGGGPMMMMIPTATAHPRFVHPQHTQQMMFSHRSRHHHHHPHPHSHPHPHPPLPGGCPYPVNVCMMMMRSPHPSHPGQMMPPRMARIGPPPRLGAPGMGFLGRGGVPRLPPPRLPLPPPPPPIAGSQIPPLPPQPPPLVPFMNGNGMMTSMQQTQLMKKLTKGKSTIKTLKTLLSQYPIDKPWVTESIRREYEKKMDLEERLKGNKDDDLFAQFKVQRDKFVGMYELARDEYLKQEADAIKAKVI